MTKVFTRCHESLTNDGRMVIVFANKQPDAWETRIDAYDEASFRRLHLASGQWVVVLDYPPHPERPQYYLWW